MADGEGAPKGDEGGKPKGEEGKPKAGDPITQERLDAEVARRHKAEATLAKLEKDKADGAEAALKEQNKWKELYEGAAPKAKLAEDYEKSIGEYFDAEVADLSDEH